MIYTISCIICTTLLGIVFKCAEQFNARAQAIIPINYLVCFITGFFISGFALFDKISFNWLPYSLVLGCLFIAGFSFFAKSILRTGLPIAILFQKMSVVLTVLFAMLLGDIINLFQLAGLIIGIFSIYFIIDFKTNNPETQYKSYGLLFGILVLSSAIEIIFIYIDKTLHLSPQLKFIMPSYIFLVAGILGFIFFLLSHSLRSITKWELIFGILLGIPNFFSIYFLMMALERELNGSVFFPALNCSVIALSSVIGWYFFKDKLNLKQLIGILLSMISIFLLTYFKKH